jgi:hypothetical protein
LDFHGDGLAVSSSLGSRGSNVPTAAATACTVSTYRPPISTHTATLRVRHDDATGPPARSQGETGCRGVTAGRSGIDRECDSACRTSAPTGSRADVCANVRYSPRLSDSMRDPRVVAPAVGIASHRSGHGSRHCPGSGLRAVGKPRPGPPLSHAGAKTGPARPGRSSVPGRRRPGSSCRRPCRRAGTPPRPG